ncbi:MAG TPA: hypothetical protein DCZ20_07705 [Lachnospiraceae bacterium]|nr:hypothetical protein [Lachnospiraceae bacterium]
METRVYQKGIGNIICHVRREKEIKQKELCFGLCSDSELARIEMDLRIPDYFLLTQLLSRLGKSVDKFELIQNRNEYHLYRLRYQIMREMQKNDLPKAEKLLKEYAGAKAADKVWHKQYVKWIEAQLCWNSSGDPKKALSLGKEALHCTMPVEKEKEIWKYPLSVTEIQILLFQWHMQLRKGNSCQIEKRLKKALVYVEANITDSREKVRIYPEIVWELSKILWEQEDYEKIYSLCGQAYELLCAENIYIGMAEIIEMLIGSAEKLGKDTDRILRLKNERKAVCWLQKQFGIRYGLDWNGALWDKEIALDYEILYRQRCNCHMTQENAAMQICTQEHLSRIEHGKLIPSETTFRKLAERLQIPQQKIEKTLCTESFAMLEEKNKLTADIVRLDFEEAQKQLEKLKDLLIGEDLLTEEDRKQKQFLKEKEICIRWWKKQMTNQEALEQLREALQCTREHLEGYLLTRTEINILIQMAVVLSSQGDVEEAVRLYTRIMEDYLNSDADIRFHVNSGTVVGNLALALLESGKREEACRYAEEHLRIQAQCGKLNDIVRSLILLGEVGEDEGELLSIRDTEGMCYFAALQLSFLLKENRRYQDLEAYLKAADE